MTFLLSFTTGDDDERYAHELTTLTGGAGTSQSTHATAAAASGGSTKRHAYATGARASKDSHEWEMDVRKEVHVLHPVLSRIENRMRNMCCIILFSLPFCEEYISKISLRNASHHYTLFILSIYH